MKLMRLLVAGVLLGVVGCSASEPSPGSVVQSPPASAASTTATPTPTVAATATVIAPSSNVPPTFPPSPAPTPTAGTFPPTQPPVASPTGSPRSLVIAGTPFANLGSSEGGFDWSPTGEWILVRHGDTVSLIQASDISVVRSYEVPNEFYADSTWIDPTSFFVYSSVTTSDHFTGTAWRGSVSSPDLAQTDIPWYHEQNGTDAIGLGNGHGAVAFRSGYANDQSCGGECPRFRIWSDGSTSDEMEGWPTAWSLDGSRLAVVRPSPQASTSLGKHVLAAGINFDSGWLEVLSYPALQPIYANRDIDVADIDMAFSPSGRYLLAETDHYEVLDFETQKVTQAPSDWPTYWYGDDKLATLDGRDLIAYSLDGAVADRWKDAGDGPLAASPDGRLLVTTDHFRTPKYVSVVRDDQMSSFKMPDLVGLSDIDLVMPTPANGDRSIVLLTETPAMFGPLLVLQVPN